MTDWLLTKFDTLLFIPPKLRRDVKHSDNKLERAVLLIGGKAHLIPDAALLMTPKIIYSSGPFNAVFGAFLVNFRSQLANSSRWHAADLRIVLYGLDNP